MQFYSFDLIYEYKIQEESIMEMWVEKQRKGLKFPNFTKYFLSVIYC